MSKAEYAAIPKLSVQQFVEMGLLQEVNRLFFHPRGLALTVRVEQGQHRLGDIWDGRSDPEGFGYSRETLATPEAAEKAEAVAELMEPHATARQQSFGGLVQPLTTHATTVVTVEELLAADAE